MKRVDPVLSSADTMQVLTGQMQDEQASFAENSDYAIGSLATMVDYLASTDAYYYDISYITGVLDDAVAYYDAITSRRERPHVIVVEVRQGHAWVREQGNRLHARCRALADAAGEGNEMSAQPTTIRGVARAEQPILAARGSARHVAERSPLRRSSSAGPPAAQHESTTQPQVPAGTRGRRPIGHWVALLWPHSRLSLRQRRSSVSATSKRTSKQHSRASTTGCKRTTAEPAPASPRGGTARDLGRIQEADAGHEASRLESAPERLHDRNSVWHWIRIRGVAQGWRHDGHYGQSRRRGGRRGHRPP